MGTTTTTTVMDGDACEDIEQNHCQLYFDEGYCAYSNVMADCRKTCGVCGDGTTATTTVPVGGACEDTEQNHCQFYMDEGYCETSASVMAACRETCGLCDDSEDEP